MTERAGRAATSGRDEVPGLRDEHKRLTREKLLAAGRTVFESVGYPAASVESIVVEAGASRGTFYLHFKNKAELMAELFAGAHPRNIISNLDAIADDTELTHDFLVAWLNNYFDGYRRDRRIIRAWLQAESREPSLRAQSDDIISDVVTLMAAKFLPHMLERDEEEAKTAALLMLSQLEHYAYFSFVRQLPQDHERAPALLARQWLTLMAL